MRQTIVGLCLLLFSFPAWTSAQPAAADSSTVSRQQLTVQFGYFSYSSILELMPEYHSAKEKLTNLQSRYDAELQRADKEFNRKFAEYLEGQNDFPENILIKRQKELQDLMEKSLSFKSEIKALTAKARHELLMPVRARLDEAIKQIGTEQGLNYILNTDGNACPYIDPRCGIDVSPLIKARLKVKD
ncbi:MAG: OmpH family outer membrane protein [Bacteroidaceae bacterium]|nr:OmpH family outer membrane protein [Bacteroidaceae bacterium]